MSFAATHIKFAIDIMDHYEISDISKYIAGSVYPDSRCLSGLSREVTHTNFEPKTDFEKGWQTHIICDEIHKDLRMKLLVGDYDWPAHQAVKSIQDLDVVRIFNIKPYLKFLDYAENPNGEDLDKILASNRIIQKIYDKEKMTVEDECRGCSEFLIAQDDVDMIKKKTKEFLKDEEIVGRIKAIYPESLRMYSNNPSTFQARSDA